MAPAIAAGRGRKRRFGGFYAKRDDADFGDFDHLAAHRIAVEFLMARVQVLHRLFKGIGVDVNLLHRYDFAEALAEIAHVQEAANSRLALMALATEIGRRLSGNLAQLLCQAHQINRVGAVQDSAGAVHPLIGEERAQGRTEAGMRRHHDARHIEPRRHVGRMQRAGPAERRESEAAVV